MSHAIEADDGVDSDSVADSGYDDTICSSDSLRSSVYAYERENGRTYHAFHAGKYQVPNDEGEQERMDIHYHALRLSIKDKIFHAPIKDPQGILDVGAGTGIWAMDAADTYPSAQVIGFDLSPIQPTVVPPNLSFEICDLDDGWNYGADRFDLVHTRFMNGFSIKDWDHVYQEAYSCLKPGGWVENQEFDCQVLADDGTIPPNSKVQEWVKLWNQAMGMIGMTGRCDPEVLAQKMRNAGFINVHIRYYKMPIGPWPKDPMLKEAGVYGLVAIIDGMAGLSMKVFTNLLGWSVEALEVFLVEVRREFKRRSIHSYWPCFIVLGQKPEQVPIESHTSHEAIDVMDTVQDSTPAQQHASRQHSVPTPQSSTMESKPNKPHQKESLAPHQETKEPIVTENLPGPLPQEAVDVSTAAGSVTSSDHPDLAPGSQSAQVVTGPSEQSDLDTAQHQAKPGSEQTVTASAEREQDLEHTDHIT